MFRAGDPRPQAHDMKANRSHSNEGPRAKSDRPRLRSYHHASERLGVSEVLHVLVAFALMVIMTNEVLSQPILLPSISTQTL